MKAFLRGAHATLMNNFYRLAASGFLPAKYFRDEIPPETARRAVKGEPRFEIVSHCWKYSSMLVYQLSSLANYPPTRSSVLMTVFYSEEDLDTVSLLDFFGRRQVPRVKWNWRPLPSGELFRRAIGRNIAALSTQADWIWMTDCDVIFHRGCLDSLADIIQGRKDILLYPRQDRITALLPGDSSLLRHENGWRLVDIPTGDFETRQRDRARGAYQIVHGDVARAIGYCRRLKVYLEPAAHWCKCYEDRAFRWLAGTPGTQVDVAGVYQIRHMEKGRYKQGSPWSAIRGAIRRMQE